MLKLENSLQPRRLFKYESYYKQGQTFEHTATKIFLSKNNLQFDKAILRVNSVSVIKSQLFFENNFNKLSNRSLLN